MSGSRYVKRKTLGCPEGSSSGSGSKRSKESEEEIEDYKVVFLYFGVWRFGKFQLTFPKVLLPLTTVIGIDEDELIPSGSRANWTKWKQFIAKNEEKCQEFLTEAQKRKHLKREFKLIEDLSTHSSYVYIYKTIPHQACSHVTLGWWLRLYNVSQGTLQYSKCKNAAHGNHEWLLPFLYDNKVLSLRQGLSESMKQALCEAQERAQESRERNFLLSL